MMVDSGQDPERDSTSKLLVRALLHPLAFLGLAVGLLSAPSLRQAAVPVATLLYLAAVGCLLLAWSRGPRAPRGARRLPAELRGRARELADGVVALESEIRRLSRTRVAEVRAALAPVVDEVSDLTARAVRLAQNYQRALDHREMADVAGIEEDRATLARRRDESDDPVIRRQLDEAIASVDRRIADLEDLRRAALRCEAAILNIQTTLEGLQTRVLKFATSERGVTNLERQELAEEIDAVRATSAALEDLIGGETSLYA